MDDALYFFCRQLARMLCAALFRFRAYHLRRVPASGAALFVSNHQSYLDPALAGIALARVIHFMARRSLFVGPLGWLIRGVHAFPVERDRADLPAMRQAIDLLRAGKSVMVFPEGTRSPDGRLGRVRPGAALFARRAGVPIVPVYIDGSYRAWPRQQWVPHPGTVRVWYGAPVPVPPGVDERAMARRIEELLAGLEAEARAFRARIGERQGFLK